MHLFVRPLILVAALISLSGCASPQGNDDDATDTCDLLAGDAQPAVFIDEPNNGDMDEESDAINWLVRIEDEDSEVTAISLVALDVTAGGAPQDIDFDLPTPNGAGQAAFTLSGDTLGSGVIVVRIEATDPSGCKGDDQVVLCIDVPASDCEF
jgi:hypothetical protein